MSGYCGHGGIEETNLTKVNSIELTDFIRTIVSQSSRSISLKNMLDSSFDYLKTLGFITDVENVRFRTVTNITSNHGLLLTNDIILADATAGAIDINLMSASDAYDSVENKGYVFTVKKINATSNNISINANGAESIDGSSTVALIGLDHPSVSFVSDGSNWWTIE